MTKKGGNTNLPFVETPCKVNHLKNKELSFMENIFEKQEMIKKTLFLMPKSFWVSTEFNCALLNW
jgi:hypothetical protein